MNHIHLTNDDVIGSHEWKGRIDLLNIVMIGLTEKLPEYDERYELHRLLGALLSKELTTNEKLDIIGTEYDIPLEEKLREDVNIMCNLSQGIKEEGIAIGQERGEKIGQERGEKIGQERGEKIGQERGEVMTETRIIINMHKNGFTAEQIATAIDKDIREVESIVEEKTEHV